MKKLKQLMLIGICLLVYTGCSTPEKSSQKIESKKEESVSKSVRPTIFIHGYSGNHRTMNTMMKQLEKDDLMTQEMVMEVSESGELHVETDLKGSFNNNNPGIRLVYSNSKSDQWHQADWLKIALTYLKTNYQVEAVNVVGYSMGGTSSLLNMETYSQEESQPVIKKLVAIGSPFNEFLDNNNQTEAAILEQGPQVVSEQLANYTDLVTGLPKESSFLLIGGNVSEEEQGDGTVPLNSSLGIYHLLKNQGHEVSHYIVSGNQASHGRLKNNSEVIEQVGKFLWK